MARFTGNAPQQGLKKIRDTGASGSRRSFSVHSKKVNNAFLIVFEQYEKAFEELAKV